MIETSDPRARTDRSEASRARGSHRKLRIVSHGYRRRYRRRPEEKTIPHDWLTLTSSESGRSEPRYTQEKRYQGARHAPKMRAERRRARVPGRKGRMTTKSRAPSGRVKVKSVQMTPHASSRFTT